MALSTIALASIAQLEAVLKLAGGQDTAGCEEAINRASELIERDVVSRPIKSRIYTNLRLPAQRSPVLFPPAAPIGVSPLPIIKLFGVAQTVWKAEADGAREGFDVWVETGPDEWAPNHFYRRAGWGWSGSDLKPILLTYTGGFTAVPERYQLACLEWAQELYRLKTQGTQGMETITTPTGTFTKSARAVPPRVEQLIGADRLVSV